MSDPQQSLLLTLLLLLFIIQPILLGAFVRKVHRRSGLLWGLLAFSMDVGTLVLFERHMAAQVFADAAAEVGTAIILSTIVIVAILVSLDGGPQTRAGAEPSINFRRGLFRIWVLISGSWIIFCATTFVNKCFSRYACDFFSSGSSSIYFDIGTRFIGIPLLAFMACLALCWVVEGFGRSSPRSSGESAPGDHDAAAAEIRRADGSDLSNPRSAAT